MPELLITPDNVDVFCGPPNATAVDFGGHRRVLNFRPPVRGYGSCMATPIEDILHLIPRDEWDDRIAEKDAADSWLLSSCKNVLCKDQNGLGYCHAYGTVSCAEIAEVMAGYPYNPLSAESVGGIVTGWRNDGADPEDDLQCIVSNGACEASFMDAPNSIRPDQWMDGWETNALTHRVKEAWDLRVPGKAFDAVVTCSLFDFPVGLGYVWWSHFVHGGFRVRKNKAGIYEILNRNSWGSTYGDSGYFWLQEGEGRGQGTPDWAFAVRVPSPQGA